VLRVVRQNKSPRSHSGIDQAAIGLQRQAGVGEVERVGERAPAPFLEATQPVADRVRMAEWVAAAALVHGIGNLFAAFRLRQHASAAL
jgi:hypothetical protein